MTSEIKKFKEDEKNLRIVPMNLEAEQALLASLLTSNSVYERISDFFALKYVLLQRCSLPD